MASVVFLRAANVGGKNVLSTAKVAKELGLMNVGAAGTFISGKAISAVAVARALPFKTAVVIWPAAEVIALIEEGKPEVPAGAQLFVSVLVRAPTKHPALSFERPEGGPWAVRVIERRGQLVVGVRRMELHRGLELSALLQRAFGVPATTRSWGTLERVAAAICA